MREARSLVYEDAGHLISGSYRPLGMGGVTYHPEVGMLMDLGGSPQADAWAEALRFLSAIDWSISAASWPTAG